MFRGGADAKIDAKGRLKVPTKFRELLLSNFGADVFLTSFGPPSMRIYPISEWKKIEKALRSGYWGDDPRVSHFLPTVAVNGDEQFADGQGRLFIHKRLRKHTRMEGAVVVLGHLTNLLEVWNEKLLDEVEAGKPLNEETIRFVSGIIREAMDEDGKPPRSGDGPGSGGGPRNKG